VGQGLADIAIFAGRTTEILKREPPPHRLQILRITPNSRVFIFSALVIPYSAENARHRNHLSEPTNFPGNGGNGGNGSSGQSEMIEN
jgi:hypothetical protein